MTPHLNQLVAVNNQLCQREKLTAEAVFTLVLC